MRKKEEHTIITDNSEINSSPDTIPNSLAEGFNNNCDSAPQSLDRASHDNDPAPTLDLAGKYLETRSVPIDQILEHPELAIRGHYELKTLELLENIIRYRRPGLPVIILFLIGGVFYIADGLYRLLAHKRAGAKSITAEIRVGTIRDAMLFRFRANANHGVPLTLDERRGIAERMFEDDEWKHWAWNFIAIFCGLSDKTVKSLWRKKFPNRKFPRFRTYIRNGKIIQLDTANIGKKKKANPAPELPADSDAAKTGPSDEPDAHDQSESGPINNGENPSVRDKGDTQPGASKDEEAEKPNLAAEAQARQNVKRGEVFLFESLKTPGKFHILACADSTDVKVYAYLFCLHMAGLFLTDLPYNRNLQSKIPVGATRHEYHSIANDDLSPSAYRKLIRKIFANAAAVLEEGSAFFIFYGLGETIPTYFYVERILGRIRKTMIWAKDGLKQNWSPEFRDGHECAVFGNVGAKLRFWDGSKAQTTVFYESEYSRFASTKLPRATHPCPKPVPMIAHLIEVTLELGGRLFDPLMGGGASLIAAEITGRLATGIELVPAFVAVTIEWAERIGLTCIRTTLEDLPDRLAELEATANLKEHGDN